MFLEGACHIISAFFSQLVPFCLPSTIQQSLYRLYCTILELHSVICCYTIYLQPRININAKRIIFLLRIMIAYVIQRILLIFFPILVAILLVVLKFSKLSYIMIIPV